MNRIFLGITGTWEGYVPTASIPYNRGVFASGYSIVGAVVPAGAGTLSSYNKLNNCIRIEKGGGAFLYFPPKSMIGINKINLAYQSNVMVVLGVNLTMENNNSTGTQFDETRTVAHIKGTSSSNAEVVISLDVSALTNNQYIYFGEYVGSSGYIDICKIWYT